AEDGIRDFHVTGVQTCALPISDYFEKTRLMVQQFTNAREPEEIIFTKGTTESINLVAATFGRKFVQQGDEIIISSLEHHSNIVRSEERRVGKECRTRC